VVAGFFNYTEPATLLNDEALLVLGSARRERGRRSRPRGVRQIADFFRAEIERILAGSAD
jgi:hypothetical protein